MKALFAVCLSVSLFALVAGHGYMIQPAARNSMWRKGFHNPKDYDDNGLNCGGIATQWQKNHGLNCGGITTKWQKNHGACGVCGDAAHLKVQPHNDGGKWSNGIIAAKYKSGQKIDIKIVLTRSHLGYMEFRIGDFTGKKTVGNKMGKLQGQLMKIVGGGTKLPVDHGTGNYVAKLKLPAGLKCSRCVIQWWYHGGNNWGCDPDHKCGMGHGNQEHFVNCADVSIA